MNDFEQSGFLFSGTVYLVGPNPPLADKVKHLGELVSVVFDDGEKALAIFSDEDLAWRFVEQLEAAHPDQRGRYAPFFLETLRLFNDTLAFLHLHGRTRIAIDPVGGHRKTFATIDLVRFILEKYGDEDPGSSFAD